MSASENAVFAPKIAKLGDQILVLSRKLLYIVLTNDAVEPIGEKLVERLRRGFGLCSVLTDEPPDAKKVFCLLQIKEQLPQIQSNPEGFVLRIDQQGILLEACSEAGLFYGANELCRRIFFQGGQWCLTCGEWHDWPDLPWRGVLIDPARNFIPVKQVFRYLDWMAENRLNVLHIHFTDNEQFTLEVPGYLVRGLNQRVYNYTACGPIGPHPFTLSDIVRIETEASGFYGREEIKTIVTYAAERYIQIIPEVAFPSHCAPILKVHPELMCRTGVPASSGSGKRPSESILCIGNPKTFQLYEDFVEHLAPLFPAPYWHIGADEIDTPVAPFAKQSWDRCEVCREVMRREGYQNLHALFYAALRKIHDILAQHGKQMIMWNDYIDIAQAVDLPRDILIHFWRIADKNWPIGPRRGCAYAKFAQAGFKLINSHYQEAYLDGLMHDKRLADWEVRRRPSLPAARRGQVLGAELCAWGRHDYFTYALPVALAYFGARLWNQTPIVDLTAFARDLARHLFGAVAPSEIFNVFEALGSILPPCRDDGLRVFPPDEIVLPGRQNWTSNGYQQLLEKIDVALANGRVSNRDILRELRLSVQAAASA